MYRVLSVTFMVSCPSQSLALNKPKNYPLPYNLKGSRQTSNISKLKKTCDTVQKKCIGIAWLDLQNPTRNFQYPPSCPSQNFNCLLKNILMSECPVTLQMFRVTNCLILEPKITSFHG